jgi:hypothetical protein
MVETEDVLANEALWRLMVVDCVGCCWDCPNYTV